MRDYSSHMIKEKLKQRKCEDEIIKNTVEYLCENGYVDDREYALNLISSLSAKKKGRKYIEFELRKRGIEDDLVSELVESNYVSPIEAAFEAELRKYGVPFEELGGKEKGKIINKLMRMGYSYEEISGCFGRICEDA